MPKKQSQSSKDNSGFVGATPQQFIIKFIQKNYERRQIDEQSFSMFNKFAMIIGKQLSKNTLFTDVQGFGMMVKTVFENFQYLNKNKSTFNLYLQLLEICMQIFSRAVSLSLSKQICCQLLDILWPLYMNSKKQQTFINLQKRLKSINIPKQLTDTQTMTKINEYQTLPPLPQPGKYQSLINHSFRQIRDSNRMRTIMTSFMNLQGQNYLDSILQTINKCIEVNDSQQFKNILKIYLCIGQTNADQSKNLAILITKILNSKNKIEFLYHLFCNAELQKFYEPNHLLYVSINVLDTIFTERIINEKTLQLMKIIGKYLSVFRQISKIAEQQKMMNLYNKVLAVLFIGKNTNQTVEKDLNLKRIKSSQNVKQKTEKQDLSAKKISFINQIANQLNASQMEQSQSKKQQQQKVAQIKYQHLKPQQSSLVSINMKKILLGLIKNPKTSATTKKIYSQSSQRFDQFMKICKQNVSHITPECLQLVLSTYIPLISENKNEQFANIAKEESNLMKIIKLHMLEAKIQNEKIGAQKIIDTYYKPIHQRFTNEEGTNFDFLALTILHEHIHTPKKIISYLIKNCLDHIQQNSEKKALYFRYNIALIASILDLHHNIVIKLSYNRIKMHINKLGNKFTVQDFLSVSEVKQNKLFVTGLKVELDQERQQQILQIKEFIVKLFNLNKKLSDLINLQNCQQNSYYYMILIQLCTLCMQTIPKFQIQSQQIQSIIKLRRNNKYSLSMTINNQIINTLKDILTRQQSNICLDSQTILLHLLLKYQIVLYQQAPPEKTVDQDDQNTDRNIQVSKQRLKQIVELLINLITRLGSEPKFDMLKMINKTLQNKQQLLTFSNDQTQSKKSRLKDYIKHFYIIKFYSEATNSQQVLLLMTIKTAIKVLEKILMFFQNQQVVQEKSKLKPFKIFYDNKNCLQNQNERKIVQTYIKLRLLTQTADNIQKNLSLQQIKLITKALQQNHDEVSKLIASEQNNQLISQVQTLFKNKANFIGFLLQQITKSQQQSLNGRQISLFTLNLLKTLIDNNNNIQEIARKYMFQKLQNTQIIPKLVLDRTKKAVAILKQLQAKKKQQKNQKGENIIVNESIKLRLCQKQQQKILQQSKKIYQIMSKMLSSSNNLTGQKQQCILKMVNDMLQLDDNTNIFISIYLIRQIINIYPILKSSLNRQSFQNLTDRIFGQLMALRQIYEGLSIEMLTKKEKNQQVINISTIINFFIQNFYTQYFSQNYSFQISDSIVLTTQSLQKKISNSSQNLQQNQKKHKKLEKTCSLNQKKGSYKCLKCDYTKELCLNCALICHKNHPIVYIQPPLRNTKICQCPQDVCKINPIYQKRKQKQSLEKRRQKVQKPLPFKRGEIASRIMDQQFRQRNPLLSQYRGIIEDNYEQDDHYNSMFNSQHHPTLIRPGNEGIIQAIYTGHNNQSQNATLLSSIPMFSQSGNPIQSNISQLGFVGFSNMPQPPQPYRGATINQPNLFANQASIQDSQNSHSWGFWRSGPRPMRGGLASLGRSPESFLPNSQAEIENLIQLREQRQRHRERERQRERRQKQIILKQKQKIKRQRQRAQRAFLNQARFGLQFQERINQRIHQMVETTDNNQQDNPNKDKFQDEDYQVTQIVILKNRQQVKQQQILKNKHIYQLTYQQSYLLPIFMNMTIQLSQNKYDTSKDSQQQITWHIKLSNPMTQIFGLVNSTSKMCNPRTYATKSAKNQASLHPSPCVCRTPIAVSQKFVFILSGPKICVHLRESLITYLIQKNGSSSAYPVTYQQHLQFQPHSISVGHKNFICVAGLRQINLFEFDGNGQFTNRNSPLRYNVSNDNINKIKLTKFGIFIGLNKQVRLVSNSFLVKSSFKLPQAWIKQWCISQSGPDTFSLYVTCSQGYIFYVEGNTNSSGQINFVKKINDSRTNRPVGSFLNVKKIEGCGNLVLSTFKDKNIGHSLGRLSGQSTLTDINYIKLKNQGLDPLFDKYFIIGLSDFALIQKQDKTSKQLFIVTIYKQQINDVMAIHRGLLGFIRIKQDLNTAFSKYQTQIICGQEQKCQYFEIIWFEDKKNWIVLSLCQDGGLRITMPNKISKNVLQKQLTILKSKKLGVEKVQQSQKQKSEEAWANKNDQKQNEQKLSNSIKQHLNVKTIKDSLQQNKLEPNDFLSFIENSQFLRLKDDYTLSVLYSNSQTKTRCYEIKLVNKKKIITGIAVPEYSEIILPTRRIQGVFQVGFTNQEALYLYAFGVLKVQIKKIDNSQYTRDIKKLASLSKLNSKSQYISQQRALLNASNSSNNFKVVGQLGIYGQTFQTQFKPKIVQIMKKIQKYMNVNNPYDLNQQQVIQICLKNCNLILTNSIESKNDIVSHEQAEGFVQTIRDWLVINKQKQATCNKLYYWTKKVIYKSLRLQQILRGTKAHVFNDNYHPLRFATQTKIKYLYESLSKGEINDQDYTVLINQLYGFVNGFGEQDLGAVNQQPETAVLFYYIAKYPSLLSKIHKKIKVLQTAKIMYRVIPLYVFGYSILKYLGYHLQWIIPALCEVVGKCTVTYQNSLIKPSPLSRFVLYKFMKLLQSSKPEAWLKNVEGVDIHQCLKQMPEFNNKSSSAGNQLGGGFGGLWGLGGFGAIGDLIDQFQQDEEMLLNRAIQQSKQDAKNQGFDPNLQQPKQQRLDMIEEQVKQEQFKNVNPFIKDLIQECIKQIDYNATNIETNCQKAVVVYVVLKLALYDYKQNTQNTKDTLQFLCYSIQNLIQKLCTNYHQFSNTSTHCILMMWLNLFGMSFKEVDKKSKANQYYQVAKQSVMAVLNKFKIESVKKLQQVPNLFARRIKGLKLNTKADFIYGFISVLQKPCEATFVLLTLGCYWLFPEDQSFYNKTKYIQTIRENQKTGNINKIYETALMNIDIWKEVGDPQWLEKWIEEKKEDWPLAIELLSLYYQ